MHVRPLLRQLFGGAVGALAALALYGAYAFAAPRVAAMLPARAGGERAYSASDRRENMDRVAEIAKEKLKSGLPE